MGKINYDIIAKSLGYKNERDMWIRWFKEGGKFMDLMNLLQLNSTDRMWKIADRLGLSAEVKMYRAAEIVKICEFCGKEFIIKNLNQQLRKVCYDPECKRKQIEKNRDAMKKRSALIYKKRKENNGSSISIGKPRTRRIKVEGGPKTKRYCTAEGCNAECGKGLYFFCEYHFKLIDAEDEYSLML